MKRAEEWTKIHPLSLPFMDDVESPSREIKCNSDLVFLIEQIQLDAFKAGMSKAERIAQLTPDRLHADDDINYRSGLHWMRGKIESNIREARDNLEKLPV